jgi:hypothetical protein
MQVKNHMILLKHNCKSKGRVPYFIHFVYICILCTHHDIFVFFTIYFILNIMTYVEGSLIYLWWFSRAVIFICPNI